VDELFVVCHGSPLDEDAYIFSDFDASMNFIRWTDAAGSTSLLRHSHIPSVFRSKRMASRGSDQNARVKLRLEPGRNTS